MSIYVGYKDVLVNSYEGDVLIKDIPNKIKKEDIIEIARQELNKNRNNKLTGLNNVKYTVNPSEYDKEFTTVIKYQED